VPDPHHVRFRLVFFSITCSRLRVFYAMGDARTADRDHAVVLVGK